jgi:hypothetical protein
VTWSALSSERFVRTARLRGVSERAQYDQCKIELESGAS